MPGLFITFEGPEGSGKSTQVEMLRQALAEYQPLVVREPGGTDLGEQVRELVLHRGTMSPAAEMYLFMAARAELLAARIQPALARGRVVIADRYHDSTLAYQGGGRGLPVEWPALFPKPDRTYLLAVAPEMGMRRLEAGEEDRLEQESLGFHEAVAEAYDRLAAAEPLRWFRLDGAAPIAELHREILEDAMKLLERRLPVSS